MKVFDETLERAFFEMHEIRSDIRSHSAAGQGVEDRKHGRFEAVLAEVIDELRPHVLGGDAPELAKLWQEFNVELVSNFEARTITQTKTKGEDFGANKKVEKKTVQRIELDSLMRISQLLDRIAKELGLMPDTASGNRPGGKLS